MITEISYSLLKE